MTKRKRLPPTDGALVASVAEYAAWAYRLMAILGVIRTGRRSAIVYLGHKDADKVLPVHVGRHSDTGTAFRAIEVVDVMRPPQLRALFTADRYHRNPIERLFRELKETGHASSVHTGNHYHHQR
jgi:hypothetical protein